MSGIFYAKIFWCGRRRAFALFFDPTLIGVYINAVGAA